MAQDDRRQRALQAMQNLRDKRMDEAEKARFRGSDRSRNLAQGSLDKDVHKVSGGSMSADITEPTTRIKTGTDRIDTKNVGKLTGGGDFAKASADRSLQGDLKATFKAAAKAGDNETMDKLRRIASKMAKGARTGVKGIPIIGGLAAAIGSGDASAAVPILGDADAVGMSPEAEDMFMAERQGQKDYGQSQAASDRARALAKLAKMQE